MDAKNSLYKLHLNLKKSLNYKNLWLFSSKQEKEIFKRIGFFGKYQAINCINFNQITNLNLKKLKNNSQICYYLNIAEFRISTLVVEFK